MKIVEPGIRKLLIDLADSRVYALQATQNAETPFIIFQNTDGENWRDINQPAGICQAYIQIDVYAGEYYQSKMLAAKVETILDGFRGTVYHDDIEDADGNVQDNVTIAGITKQSGSDSLDQTDAPHLYRHTAQYLVTYHQQ